MSDIFSRYIINNLKGREKIFTRPSSSKARKQKFCQKTNKCISFLLMNEAEVSLPYKVEDNDGEGESSILVHLALAACLSWQFDPKSNFSYILVSRNDTKACGPRIAGAFSETS